MIIRKNTIKEIKYNNKLTVQDVAPDHRYRQRFCQAFKMFFFIFI